MKPTPKALLLRVVKNYLTESQKTVAESMGVSPSYLSDLMVGRRDWSPKMLDRYAIATKAVSALPELHMLGARAAGWRI